MAPNGTTNGVPKPDYDTIVIGAGIAGLRIIHELQKLKQDFKVLEAGSNVGGTWYWNRYPGARTDSESWVYILNFSEELNAEWTWKERFPQQPEEITKTGLRLERPDARTNEDTYDFDVMIFCIGFDACTGPLSTINVRGREDKHLGELWGSRLQTLLAMTVTGFPNMFMISGPQAPFANYPVVIDNACDWIGKFMTYMEKHDFQRTEPTQEAMDQWTKLLTDVYEMTVLPDAAKKAGSWYIGANIPGKRIEPLFWFGGVKTYFALCDQEQNANYPGMAFA